MIGMMNLEWKWKKIGWCAKNELDRYLEGDVEDDHVEFKELCAGGRQDTMIDQTNIEESKFVDDFWSTRTFLRIS